MAYDAQKAHEYYLKYRKKGLKKGRKKGSSKKKTSSTGLIGISLSGLNDEGRMEAALIKDDFKRSMNAELSKAKTDEEQNEIRRQYQKKAFEAIQKLKQSSQYAKPKTTREKTSDSSRSTGSSRKSSSESSESTERTVSSAKTSTSAKKRKKAALQKRMKKLLQMISQVQDALSKMSDEQKEETELVLTSITTKLKNAGQSQ